MSIHTISDTADTQKSTGRLLNLLDINVPDLQRTLKLAGLLQTSLEVENILRFFVESIRETIPFSSLQYQYAPLKIETQIGKDERHHTIYRLNIAGEDLGELKFTRNKRFSETDLELLENQIYHLVYPLRNALLYQHALKSAQIDGLTGINNRAALDQTVQREVGRARRHHLDLSLLLLDVDHFKSINDNFGHSAGDHVLRSLTTCIKDTLRSCDMLFRYGGEEFALLLTDTDSRGAYLVAERVRQAIEMYPIDYNAKNIPITVSIGVASLSQRDTIERLFNKADAALYQAKSDGRNAVAIFTSALRKA